MCMNRSHLLKTSNNCKPLLSKLDCSNIVGLAICHWHHLLTYGYWLGGSLAGAYLNCLA